MSKALDFPDRNVIPVWGLTPEECLEILFKVHKFIAQGRASAVREKQRRAYICIFDRRGAPYTIGREQRILHLLGPSGELITISKNLEAIMDALDSSLQDQNSTAI